MFHCTPSSRLAWRLASMKRTSSMICCGCITWTVLIGSGPNWRAIITALSRVTASGRGAAEHDAAVDRRHLDAAAGEARDLRRQPRNVVGHFDVENADRLLVLAVDRDARGADLLAENRQRMIGERIDVGDIRIADRDIDQVLVGMHVLRLADRHHHRRGVGGAGERDPLLRLRSAGRENQRRGDQLPSTPARTGRAATARRSSCSCPRGAGLRRRCLRSLYWLFTSASPPLLCPQHSVHRPQTR